MLIQAKFYYVYSKNSIHISILKYLIMLLWKKLQKQPNYFQEHLNQNTY